MQTLIDYIAKNSQKRVLRISTKEPVMYSTMNSTKETKILSLTTSKFGGYPYWPSDLEYPCNKEGEKLFLLAQIIFDELNYDEEILPQTGILQFFITSNNLYGLNFDDFMLTRYACYLMKRIARTH